MRKLISYATLFGGILFYVLGFCVTFNPSTADASGIHISNNNIDLLLIFVNLGCFAIGTLLCWIAVKIHPEMFSEALSDEECTVDDYEPERHDYSADFEELYKFTIRQKADRLIGEDKKAQK